MGIMFLQILQHAVREYDAKLDIKRRMSLRSGHFEYDHVSEYVDHFNMYVLMFSVFMYGKKHINHVQ